MAETTEKKERKPRETHVTINGITIPKNRDVQESILTTHSQVREAIGASAYEKLPTYAEWNAIDNAIAEFRARDAHALHGESDTLRDAAFSASEKLTRNVRESIASELRNAINAVCDAAITANDKIDPADIRDYVSAYVMRHGVKVLIMSRTPMIAKGSRAAFAFTVDRAATPKSDGSDAVIVLLRQITERTKKDAPNAPKATPNAETNGSPNAPITDQPSANGADAERDKKLPAPNAEATKATK